MKITSLEPQKRGNRRNLEIDGEFCCGIDESLILEFNLYTDKEITEPEIGKILKEDEYQKCLKKAYDILAIRLNSEKELRVKLLKKFEYPIVKRVIGRVKELGYINDETFVKSWVEGRERTHGEFVLKRELGVKGIDKTLTEQYFAKRSKESDLKNALELVNKKRWPEMNKEERYKKIGGFLSRRGFDYEVIKKVLNQ